MVEPMEAPARLRLALVGLGPQGMEHLRASERALSVDIVAGVDINPACRKAAELSFPHLAGRVLESPEELRELSLEGLVLALPHHTYGQVWSRLLDLRLPMLKEKPLGRTQDEARDFMNSARLSSVPLQTAIQRRHHPSYAELKRLIDARQEQICEVHAHLHLGFAPDLSGASDKTWRDDVGLSGGGTLLDSGYHMVDLLHFVVGPFELVASTLLHGRHLAKVDQPEDRVWLNGRTARAWVSLDSWLHGEPDTSIPGGHRKSEGLLVRTDRHLYRADRSGLWIDDDPEPFLRTSTDWERAMASQLDEFGQRIKRNHWDQPDLWDQLPAMQVIDEAYRRARRF